MLNMSAQYDRESQNHSSWVDDYEEDQNDGIQLSEEQEERLNQELDVILIQKQVRKEKRKKTGIICGIAAALVLGGVFLVRQVNDADDYDYDWNTTSSDQEVDGDPFELTGNNTFLLDGETYTIPFQASDLIENDWQIVFDDVDDEVDSVSEYDSAYIAFVKNGKEIHASLTSYDGDTVALEDADVSHIYIDEFRTPEFTGPLGFRYGMSKNDVQDIIEDSGYAYRIYESDYSTSYYLQTDIDEDYDYSVNVYLWEDEVSSISLYYYSW